MSLTLPRRTLLAACGGVVLFPGLAMAQPRRLAFTVLRNGAKIGEHVMTFSGAGEAMTASTEVEMTVKLGPVPVYRYRHTATERWAGGRFASLETRTNANGKAKTVSAEAGGSGVEVNYTGGRVRAPVGASPLTHWNPKALAGPLFNPQEGKLLKVRATRAGPGHWQIRGEAEIDNFYDGDGVWTGLKGKLEDGSQVEYRRV